MNADPVRRPGRQATCRIAVCLAATLVCFGCAHNPPWVDGGAGTSPAPNIAWVPPARASAQTLPAPTVPTIPAELLTSKESWGLTDLLDIALRGSSETRAAWADARSAAAAYGSARGDYLPDVDLNATVVRQQGVPSVGRTAYEQRSYGGSADLTWLLFNFGGRRASVEETRQALLAADWTHNAVIQNVVLHVEQAYYEYITVKALLAAEESTLQEAQRNLDSAEERHKAGLATIADVLQAKTALSQVQLAVETVRGQIAMTRGALATAMGLPASTSFDVDLPPTELPVEQISEDVETYIELAKTRRPDLAAARAEAIQAQAHVHRTRAEGLPSLSAVGNVGRVYPDRPDSYDDTYSAALQLRFPLFTGFSHRYDVLESKADADAALARFRGAEQRVVLEVWTSYYGFKTAEQQLKTIDDLLRSATESHEVALGRYQAGVGTILDLLAAQAALEGARARMVQARSDWLVSLAQLAHDTGTLDPSGSMPPVSGGDDPRKGSRP